MPSDIGVDDGCSRPPMRSEFGHDREHHRVVVAVVRALDLDDVVAAGRGARDADRAHRRFGARVREAHLLELEAPAQLLGEQHRVLGRRREVRAGASRARRSPRRSSGARGRRPCSRSRRGSRRTRCRRRPRRWLPVALAQVDRVRVAGLERRADAQRHGCSSARSYSAFDPGVRSRSRRVSAYGDLAGRRGDARQWVDAVGRSSVLHHHVLELGVVPRSRRSTCPCRSPTA